MLLNIYSDSARAASTPPNTGSWMKFTPKLGGVPSGGVGHVIADLILVLVAQDGESGNRRNELIVAKSFKS